MPAITIVFMHSRVLPCSYHIRRLMPEATDRLLDSGMAPLREIGLAARLAVDAASIGIAVRGIDVPVPAPAPVLARARQGNAPGIPVETALSSAAQVHKLPYSLAAAASCGCGNVALGTPAFEELAEQWEIAETQYWDVDGHLRP